VEPGLEWRTISYPALALNPIILPCTIESVVAKTQHLPLRSQWIVFPYPSSALNAEQTKIHFIAKSSVLQLGLGSLLFWL
jgi:hypothetical protein